MSSKKQIIIDPNSLSGSQTNAHNTTLKRQRKIKPPVAFLRPSTVKKNLLEKIKDYKRRNEETPSQDQPQQQKSDKDLANQFKMSSNYLEQLINKKKDARKHTTHHTPKMPSTNMQPTQTMQPMMQPMTQPMTQPMMQPMTKPMMQPMTQHMMQPMMQTIQAQMPRLQQRIEAAMQQLRNEGIVLQEPQKKP